MFKWLLNKFKKPAYALPETEDFEVGKVDLIFLFKDGNTYRRSFIGDVSLTTDFNLIDYYEVIHANDKAISFIQDRQDFGWLMVNENLLLPMSNVSEIIVGKHPFSITVDKL